MSLRSAAITALGLAFLAVGCSDQITRPDRGSAPSVLATTTYTQTDLIHWLHGLVPPDDWRGGALDRFNEIKNAPDQQAAGDALLEFLMLAYSAGATAIPDPPRADPSTKATELLAFFWALSTFYGLEFDIPQPGDIDPDLEQRIDFVSEEDFDPTDPDHEICFETNVGPGLVGNAAMCVKRNSLQKLPAALAIIEQKEEFPTPGFVRRGKTFMFEVFDNLKKDDGQGVLLVLCSPQDGDHNRPHWFIRDDGDGISTFPAHPFGYQCPESSHGSLLKGDGLFARGVNAAGSYIMSALSPRRAFADHSLAHRQFTALSPWVLGLSEDPDLRVRVTRTVPNPHTDHSMTFKPQGSFNFWIELKLDGVVQGCQTEGLALSDFVAELKGTLHGTTTTSTVTGSAIRCEAVGGVDSWAFSLSNPFNNQISSGTVDITVQGFATTPQLNYQTAP